MSGSRIVVLALLAAMCCLAGCKKEVAPTTQPQPPAGPESRPATATQPPPTVPARITYLDSAGKPATLTGELVFDAWPVLLDGKPAKIDRWELFTYESGANQERNTAWMHRQGDEFVIGSLRAVWRVKFDFDTLPLVADLAATRSAQPPAGPVFIPSAPTSLSAIDTSRIQAIDMTQVKWNPFTVKR